MCLQTVGRDFLVRLIVRKMRVSLRPALLRIAACTYDHLCLPMLPMTLIKIGVWLCGFPARRSCSRKAHSLPRIVAAISSVPLGVPNLLAGCYHMTPTVGLVPWDLGGHSCSPNLFYILGLDNKGKPRCKRLNPRSCQVGLRQLVGEVLQKGGEVLRVLGPGGPNLGWCEHYPWYYSAAYNALAKKEYGLGNRLDRSIREI